MAVVIFLLVIVVVSVVSIVLSLRRGRSAHTPSVSTFHVSGDSPEPAKTGSALTVGERVQAVLRQQGIPSNVDEDGDVRFEYHFHHYFVSHADERDYFCLSANYAFQGDERRRIEVLKIANFIHYRFRMVRMVCYADYIGFSMENLVFPDTDIKVLLGFSLDLMEAALDEAQNHMPDPAEETEQGSSPAIGFTTQRQEPQENDKVAENGNPSEETESPASQPPLVGFNSPRYKS